MQLWIASAAIALLLAALAAYRYLDVETLDLKSAAKTLLRPVIGILKFGLGTWVDHASQLRRLMFWSGINLTVIGVLIFAEPSTITLSFAAAMAALHLLSFVSALLVIDEETDVWNGLISEQQAKFRTARILKHPSVLSISTLWAALFVPLVVRLWDHVTPFPMFAAVPDTLCESPVCTYLSFLAATAYKLPGIEWLLRDIGPIAAPLSDWPGVYLTPALAFIALTLIFGVFKVVVFQKKAIGDLVVAFGRAKDESTLAYLRERAERAPEFIQEKLIANALGHHNAKMRRRYIEAMLKAGFLDFSRIFLQKLHDEPSAWNKRAGVDQIATLVKLGGGKFDLKLVTRSLDALNRQMTERKDEHSPIVLTAMDELHVAYAGLCKSKGWSLGASKFWRLFDLAILGEDDMRPRAFEVAATLRPVELCQSAIEQLTLGNLAEAKTLSVLNGSLARIENLIAMRCADWRKPSRSALAKTITARRSALMRDSQRLTNGRLRRSAGEIKQEDAARLLPILAETITDLDRIKGIIMLTLPDLPANDLLPAEEAQSA